MQWYGTNNRTMTSANRFRDLVPSIYTPALFTAIAQATTMVLLPLYVLHLGFGLSVAAFVFAVRALGTMSGTLPGGKLIERFGEKPTMLFGALCSAIAYLGIALSNNIPLVGLFCFLAGFGGSCSLLARQSYLTGRFASHQRGRVIGLLGGVIRGGSVLGPAAGGILALAFGYKAVFVGLALLCVLAFILIFRFLEAGEDNDVGEQEKSDTRIIRILVDYRQIFFTAGLATIGLQFMRSVRGLLVPLVGASIGLEVDTVGLIVSSAAMLDLVMVYPAGQVMDRFGRKAAGVPSFLVFSVALLVLSTVSTGKGLLAAALLMGLANGMTAGLVLVLGSDYAPKNNRGPFLGVWRLISDIGNASSPMAIGLLLNILSVSATGAIAGFVGLAATAVLIWAIKEPLQRQTDTE